MDICMLTPSEYAELHERIGEYENVKGKLQTCLEKIERAWKQELEYAPEPGPKTEAKDLPKSRLQILTEWIGHLDEQCVQLEDMEEVVPKDPTPPTIKPVEERWRIEDYTLMPAKRQELQTLIDSYHGGISKLLSVLKRLHKEWDEQYTNEPWDDCSNEKVAGEAARRIIVLENWIYELSVNEQINIHELDEYVE